METCHTGDKLKIILSSQGKDFEYKVEKKGKFIILNKKHQLQLDDTEDHFRSVILDGRKIEFGCVRNGDSFTITIDGEPVTIKIKDPLQSFESANSESSDILIVRCPIPGLVSSIHKKNGDRLSQGEVVLILDAMKMQNEISSPKDGILRSISVKQGMAIEKDQILFTIS